jgi:uncharacterized membrane protein
VAIIAGLLALSCIVAFLFLIDYAARMLRPVSLVQRVGQYGLAVMESVYPERCPEAQSIARSELSPGPAERTILHRGKSAIVVAVNVETLVAEAEKAKDVIEFVPQVGDFVGSGEPLFFLHGGAEAVQERKLRASVVLGAERTMEQDPLFAFRILVDNAIKALSKAINDPTTAVLAIDQLHRLLRSAGTRNLRPIRFSIKPVASAHVFSFFEVDLPAGPRRKALLRSERAHAGPKNITRSPTLPIRCECGKFRRE